MNLVCSNCGKKEGPDATYCRDCYTVFPFEIRASANRTVKPPGSLGAWKWLPILALVAGGALLTQIDYGQTEKTKEAAVAGPAMPARAPQRARQEAAASDGGLTARAPDRIADRGQSDLASRGAALAKRQARVKAAILAANQYLGWVLMSDAELACPSSEPCPAIIRFSSGEHASYFVEQYVGMSNTVIPASDEASLLLGSHRQGLLEVTLPNGHMRSVQLEKRSNRWAFGATDAASETNSEDIPAPRVREE